MGVFAGVFEQHGLSASENSSFIDCGRLEAILWDIFFVAKAEIQAINGKQFDQQLATELSLNLILNTFDIKRKGKLRVIDIKVVFAILSCGSRDPAMFIRQQNGRERWAQSRIMECYRYIFFQIYDANSKMADRSSLSNLFITLATFVGIFLKEWRSFGLQFVPSTLYSCLQEGNELAVGEEDFLKWLNSGPRLLVWFTTLHRMMTAESVKHDGIRCTLCKTSPIAGLRFRCLSCFMHDQCQECFLQGKTNGRHKLSHPMYEYCLPTTGKEERQALIKTLKNRVKSGFTNVNSLKEKQEGSIWERRSVAFVENEPNPEADKNMGETHLLIQEMELAEDTDDMENRSDSGNGSVEIPCPPKYPKEELSSIIGHLEEGHRDLGEQIEGLCMREKALKGGNKFLGMCMGGEIEDSMAGDYVRRQLQGTREQLEEQVARLKALQECLQKIQPTLSTAVNQHQAPPHLQSTPMPRNNRVISLAHGLPRLEDFSPIFARGGNEEVRASADRSESIGAILSKCKSEVQDPSAVELEVSTPFSPSIATLTEVSPNDLSTVLMARWRGGMKGFVGSSQVNPLHFPSSSILSSPRHTCSSTRSSKRQGKPVEELPESIVEIQRDLDWVLGELDAMLVSHCADQSSTSSSGVTSVTEEASDCQENQNLCSAATQLEELLADLIRVVERQKQNGIDSSDGECGAS
ncbi:hypothetical protein J437_LFUL006903 [Ladona fulva]|uniref:ZZ-type domain-containing protein n=1 Tax=Ladona fulva TaxID=123851 RepID=A0A8K0K5S2_LADFU|nr:hypothetical protein J437_LFUL006903 [Ladona fulva]